MTSCILNLSISTTTFNIHFYRICLHLKFSNNGSFKSTIILFYGFLLSRLKKKFRSGGRGTMDNENWAKVSGRMIA